ncbi:MAG: hypothetical protein AAFX08_09835 [Pseudomonadota bacterium]
MPWRVEVSTVLDTPVERAWDLVRRPKTLVWIASPLLKFKPIDPPAWPEVWPPGRHRAAMSFLGVLPLGRQWVDVSFPDPAPDDGDGARIVRDNGSGDLVKVWDHWIHMRPRPDGRTDYVDRVDVAAGLLTPFIWLFAQLFYRWRQHRWRRLARSGLPSLG